jgi:hypothetical protein
MTNSKTKQTKDTAQRNPPPLELESGGGEFNVASVANIIQWFLDYDERVAAVKHPKVEELFQWKQELSRSVGEEVYLFKSAEDRFAVGIMQALTQNKNEVALHSWISQLLNALEDASKTNEEMASAYNLSLETPSVVSEASKIPTTRGRNVFLTCCWLEALCTAEVRVLGWIYQELYGRPYTPQTMS